MANKKNTTQTQKAFKHEDYIRTKARQLSIYKCYKLENNIDDRELAILVIRQHPQGTFTYAGYMIDRWCLGIKDSMWQFSIDKEDLQADLALWSHHPMSLTEIDYVEAHNWVYGALAFAEEAGIKPCKDFQLTQFILAPDDDEVELREYDFGHDGKYCLAVKDNLEASKYIPILDKNLGKGQYSVQIGFLHDWDDDEDWDDEDDWDEEDGWDDEDPEPFAYTPEMEYTYEGKQYPGYAELHYPELDSILGRQMHLISDSDIDWILSLPADKLREDLHNIVLRELNIQWGKTENEFADDNDCSNFDYIGNAFTFLTNVGTVEDTLPIVIETMRQNNAFFLYNFGDCSSELLHPILWVLTKDHPKLLMPFLLEKGLTQMVKSDILEMLEHMAQNCPDVRDEIIAMTVELLEQYKEDLPKRSICDGAVVAFTIGILIGNNASEHLPLIEEIYATGLVDESVEGHIDEVRWEIERSHSNWAIPPMNPYAIKEVLNRTLGH